MARAVAVAAGTGATGLKLYADLDADVVRRLVAEAHRQGLKAWVVLSADPTQDIGALQSVIGVFKGGRQLSRRLPESR